jgi:hypothetical protein
MHRTERTALGDESQNLIELSKRSRERTSFMRDDI